MLDLDLKEIVHELGDVAWCEGKNFEDWVEPRVNAILQALDERDALKAEVRGWEVYVGKLLGSLPLGDIIPASSSLKDFSDRLGKMVTENYSLRNEVAALKDELEAARKQEPDSWRITSPRFCGTHTTDKEIAAHWMKTAEAYPLYASPVPAQQECTFHGADAQACMDYSKEVPCEFTWEQEAKRAFWSGLEIGASFGSCAILPRWNEYIDKRKSELKGGEND